MVSSGVVVVSSVVGSGVVVSSVVGSGVVVSSVVGSGVVVSSLELGPAGGVSVSTTTWF